MKCLYLHTASGGYPILIGPGLLDQGELYLPHAQSQQILVVSNETVAPLYLDRVLKQCTGRQITTVILRDGEQYKNLAAVVSIIDELLRSRFSRNCTVFALGGGVVGDIAGFAAACYQRGVAYIQLPTTLLAQVDSSVGGKTGVNHPLGKNMIGAFHQPRCVIADTDTLATLANRELRAGVAEIIKYGLIRDAEFFSWLEEHIEELTGRDPAALAFAIERSCRNKAEVVAADERESDVRATLNLGHTFGHAIETGTGYASYLHGEAIAIGMCIAAELSAQLGWLDATSVARIVTLMQHAGLPTAAPAAMDSEQFLRRMAVDKKNLDGQLRLILLKSIGIATLPENVSVDILRSVLDAYPHIQD